MPSLKLPITTQKAEGLNLEDRYKAEQAFLL